MPAVAEPSPLYSALLGRVVDGRFEVRELLGGARGGVFLAHDRITGGQVALKAVAGAAHDRHHRRLQAEIRALGALDHPRVVRLVAHGELPDHGNYAAVAYVEGLSLDRWLRQHTPDLASTLRAAEDLCDALSHVHAAGIVHRDLKARNVLVTPQPLAATLIDFDAACLPDGDPIGTEEGVVGSVHTMSPEQIRKGTVDHRADLYALGILLFRMTTGHYPFHGPNTDAVLAAHLHTPPPSLAEARGDQPTPPELDALVRSLLAKDPADRPVDARAVRDVLARCRGEMPKRSWGWLLAGLAAVIVAISWWGLA